MHHILVVEDDEIINGGIQIFLQKQGYLVSAAHNRAEAEAALAEHGLDLILLDINLPDGSGLDLCESLRKTSPIPIIFLTANDTDEDMVKGFALGCDDYIAKPFSLAVLASRIGAVLRRSAGPSASDAEDKNTLHYKELHIDFNKMTVSSNGIPIKLSATEYKLLELLVQNRGQVLTRRVILERIWDCDENYIDENTLSVHIRRLRQKLGDDPKNPIYIITVFGIGYTFGD